MRSSREACTAGDRARRNRPTGLWSLTSPGVAVVTLRTRERRSRHRSWPGYADNRRTFHAAQLVHEKATRVAAPRRRVLHRQSARWHWWRATRVAPQEDERKQTRPVRGQRSGLCGANNASCLSFLLFGLARVPG